MGNFKYLYMKQYAFAALIGAATATWEEFNNTTLPSLTNAEVSVEGEVGEYMNTFEDGSEQIGMHARWTTKCNDCWFAQGALVQNYVQWPDEKNAGMFGGLTCNTVWNKNGDVASEINVNNSEFNNKNPKMSSQACGAYGPLYGKNADGNVDESYGNYYWDMKNVGTVSFTTGYRIY